MGSSNRVSFFPNLLLLLLLLGRLSKADLSSDGEEIDVLSLLSDASFPPHSLNAHSLSSSSAALQEVGGEQEGEAEEREQELLSCISSNIASVLLQAKVTKEKIDDFKDDYTRDKFGMSWTDFDSMLPLQWDEGSLEVCSVDQTCSTVLPTLPPLTTPPPATDHEAARSLTEMSSHFFRFMYAYEQIVLDQSVTEDDYASEMYDAYVNHDQLARLLEEVQEACGLTANFSEHMELHDKMHITTSAPQTDLRGFSTLRQSLQGLDLLKNLFGQGSRLMQEIEEARGAEEAREDEDINEMKRRRKLMGKSGRDKTNRKNKKGNKRRKTRHSLD